MNTVESGHFLLTVINNAEDISLFLETYNACLADDVLRGNAVLDERPLVVFGSDKRHAMCKKKLPVKYKELGLDYNESKVTFLTGDTLGDFVLPALANLKDGVVPEVQEEPVIEKVNTEEVEEVKVEENIPQQQVVETTEPQVVTEKEKPISEPVTKIEKQQPTSGMCTYGVPKLKLEYIPPNVVGLQESLFVNVDEEDISRFFQSVKNRVIGSINNDN